MYKSCVYLGVLLRAILLNLTMISYSLTLIYDHLQLQKAVFELRVKRNQHSSTVKEENTVDSTDTAVATEVPKLPPLDPPPQDTTNPFPVVTSREIGWRSAREYNLEVFGRWARPKHSILKQFKWPVDGVP